MAARETMPAIHRPLLDWNKYYSANEYNSKNERVQKCTLHFLIARNQKWELLEPYIDSLNTPEKRVKIFSADAKAHQLTPLMLAVIKGDIKIVRKLIEVAKANRQLRNQLDKQDEFGWTPLHHAAFATDEIFQELIHAKADRTIKNNFGGTPDDIKSLTSHHIGSVSAPHVFVALEDGTEIPVSEIAQDKLRLRELLDLEEYRDLPYYPPEQQHILWRAFHPEQYSPATIYEKWKRNPPKLLIRKCDALKHLPESTSTKELVAYEDMPLGRIIGPYSGVYDTTKNVHVVSLTVELYRQEKTYDYSLPPIYAHEIGNALSIANFGFPNITYLQESVGDGSEHKVYVSGGVKKGEGLLWDYGPGSFALSYGKQVLLGREEMRQFFRTDLSTIVKSVSVKSLAMIASQSKLRNPGSAKKAEQLLREYTASNLERSRLTYPLSSPGAVLDLHFSGIVSAKAWLELFDNPEISFMQNWKKFYPFAAETLRQFLNSLIDFEETMSQNHALKEPVGAWVLEKIGVLSIMQILKVFEYITQQARINSSIDWKAFLAIQEERIANYEWKDDPFSPIQNVVSSRGHGMLNGGSDGIDLSRLLEDPNACATQ
jgi:hypothetical protein